MTKRTPQELRPIAQQGRAEPLPLIKPSPDAANGRAEAMPYIEPPPDQPRANAVPLPSLTSETPRVKAAPPVVHVQRDVAERALELMRNAYVETRNMRASRHLAAYDLKREGIELYDGPHGQTIRFKPRTGLAALRPNVRSPARAGSDANHGFDGEYRPLPPTRAEPRDVAEKRRAYEAAVRSGDSDVMTRSANDLIRAVNAARSDADAPPGHTATSEGVRPVARQREWQSDFIDEITGQRGGNAIGKPRSNADVSPGHIATEEGAKRVARATSEADLPEGWTRDGSADQEEPQLTDEQVRAAAKLIMQSPEDQRAKMRRRLRKRFGAAMAGEVHHLLGTSADFRHVAEAEKSVRPQATLSQTDFWGDLWDWLFGETEEPNRLRTRLLESNTNGGRIKSRRNFELEQPSKRGGYIIQEVTIIFRPRLPNGTLGPPRVLFHFWEAWEIRAGDRSPWERIEGANDSVRFDRGEGDGGRVEILTNTRFHEGLRSLPAQFKRNPDRGQPGYDPRVDPAGGLLATAQEFELSPGSYESVTPWENNAIYTDW